MFMNELNYIVIIVIPNIHKYTSGSGLHDTTISGDTNLGVMPSMPSFASHYEKYFCGLLLI